MALDRFEVRISIQKVLLGLVLVIVPLSILGLYLTARSDRALDSSFGSHLKATAQVYSDNLSHLLNDRIAAVKLISANPALIEAVASANRSYQGQSEPAITDRLRKMEATWSKPESANAVKELLSSKPSEALRHYRDMDPTFLRMIVTDERGTPIASTIKPVRYSLMNNEAWRSVYSGDKSSIHVSKILYDESTKSYYVDIGVPVTEQNTEAPTGVVLASVSVDSMLANFQQDSLGNGAKAYLVNDDGTVVSGPRTDVFARARSEEYAAIQDSLGTLEGRQTGYVIADLRSGRQIVGFADTGLRKISKNLGWNVLISLDEHKATAPIRVLGQFAQLMVLLALFMLTLLAVYYSLHRKQQFSDIEDVLPHQTLPPPRTV